MKSVPLPVFQEISEISDQPRRNPYAVFALRAGLGLAVVAFLIWHYDARSILRMLQRESPFLFGSAIALYLAGQALCAYRWELLARLNGVPGRFREYLAYAFIGMFTNLFIPGLVGGDAARALYLGRRHNRLVESIASVIADRGVGLLALFWFAAPCALFLNEAAALPPSVIRPTVAVGVIAFAGWLAAPLLGRLVALLGGRLGRIAAPLFAYVHRPVALLPSIALSLILQASIAVCQYLIAVGLGLNIGLATFMLIVPISNVIASLPVTLGGLGVREATYVVLFGMAGVAKPDAVAMGLLWFAAIVLGGLTGALAFITTEMPTAAATIASAQSAAIK